MDEPKHYIICILVSMFCCNTVECNPNILLIVVDDLRPSLGAFGDPNAFTPNIDNLAKKSVIFTQTYAQQALCAPSRNSFLTSRRPDTLHLYDFYNYWRDTVGNFTTLPQYFKQHGYLTYSIGKIFHPGISSNFTDDFPYSWSKKPFHPNTEKYKESHVCPDKYGHRRNLVCPVSLEFQPEGTLPDIESLEEAKSFIQNRENEVDNNPYFLAVGFHKPHIPLKYPRKYLKYHSLDNVTIAKNRYRPPKMPIVAWNPWTDVRRRDDITDLNIEFPFGFMPDKWVKLITQSYHAAVTYIDDLIGQLLSEIDQSNTIIALIGDHGWSLGEHGEWSKFSNFDISTRVPFIMYIPPTIKKKVNFKVEVAVELVDLFPTLVELATLEKIPVCNFIDNNELCTEGKSLVPLIGLKNIEKVTEDYKAFSQYPRPGEFPTRYPNSDKPKLKNINIMGYSMRCGSYRYTEWIGFNNTSFDINWNKIYGIEMYNHEFDVNENINLAGKPELQNIQNELHIKLKNSLKLNRKHL